MIQRTVDIARSWRGRAASKGETARPFVVDLDYPVVPKSRYGWGRPPHDGVAKVIRRGDDRYRDLLKGFAQFSESLGRVPQASESDTDPVWRNGYFEGLDLVALYSLLAGENPTTYLEIGSGFSTRMARRAIQDHALRTRIISVDPQPRVAIAAIADEALPIGLENIDLGIFETLSAGDVLFFDGSHRVLSNSDATVFFTEVLPRLAPGVLVHVHDIFLPWDYIPAWGDRWYSEQYLLCAWLLAGDRLEVVLPNFYVSLQPHLHHLLDPILDQFIWSGMATNGSSFWFRINDTSSHRKDVKPQ